MLRNLKKRYLCYFTKTVWWILLLFMLISKTAEIIVLPRQSIKHLHMRESIVLQPCALKDWRLASLNYDSGWNLGGNSSGFT